MIFLLYTGISALIIGDLCIDHLEIFPTSKKHRNIVQLCTINILMRLSGRGEWREVEERVSSGEGGERLQLVGSWRRSWSRAGVGGGGGVGGVGGVDGGGGETQSWSRAGVWRRCHLRGWPGLPHPALALLLLLGVGGDWSSRSEFEFSKPDFKTCRVRSFELALYVVWSTC